MAQTMMMKTSFLRKETQTSLLQIILHQQDNKRLKKY